MQKRAQPKQWNDWRWQLRNRVRLPGGLDELLGTSSEQVGPLRKVARIYRFAITPYYLSLFDPRDESDPIRLQCIPDAREIDCETGGTEDPLEEETHSPVPGLIQRYRDRCLVTVTNRCAVYCRHCNRKRLWRRRESCLSDVEVERIARHIEKSHSIREVIFSGGDPLTLSDPRLGKILARLRSIPRIEVLRLGSRIPAVMPMRITDDLCRMLRSHRPIWFLTQFNHPREITREAADACDRLLSAGIPVLNQSVLLRGVNDNFRTMQDLLYGLERISVKPYYLFHCDPVQGSDHFQVDIWEGMRIMEQLWKSTSGLCLPRYVADMPGTKGKVPLQPVMLL
ncbi:MAG TPA: KamA family radical SAM protein [Syntrophales bacterium]|nr:KamA family radical SAM protein [Syntrophales bacterium]